MKISSLHVDGKPNESLVKPCGRAFCFVEASDEYNSVSTKFILSYDTSCTDEIIQSGNCSGFSEKTLVIQKYHRRVT